jgi:hypothetical protein
MYKKASEKQNWLNRTGSSATRWSSKGYNPIAPNAEVEESPDAIIPHMCRLMQQYSEERQVLEAELAPRDCKIHNWRANITYKYKGREHCCSANQLVVRAFKRYFELGDLMQDLNRKLRTFKAAARGSKDD